MVSSASSILPIKYRRTSPFLYLTRYIIVLFILVAMFPLLKGRTIALSMGTPPIDCNKKAIQLPLGNVWL